MTQDEDLMVRFALKWLPYGGGDEHILPEFGLMPTEFYRRLAQLAETMRATNIDLGLRRQLVELCSLKLTRTRNQRRFTTEKVIAARRVGPTTEITNRHHRANAAVQWSV